MLCTCRHTHTCHITQCIPSLNRSGYHTGFADHAAQKEHTIGKGALETALVSFRQRAFADVRTFSLCSAPSTLDPSTQPIRPPFRRQSMLGAQPGAWSFANRRTLCPHLQRATNDRRAIVCGTYSRLYEVLKHNTTASGGSRGASVATGPV